MNAAALRERIGGPWGERAGGWWVQVPAAGVRPAARAMLAGGARFAAMVAQPGGAGSLELSWHWDLQGALLSVATQIPSGAPVPSIIDLYPGADWAERETRDYWAVTFEGRATTPPLVLREGDEPGFLLRPEGELR
jgi:hypothetical protein